MIGAAIAIIPLDFNMTYSIGFVIGAAWWLWWFQRGEILGVPGLGIKVHLMIAVSIIAFVLLAPRFVTIGIGVGFACGVLWVILMINRTLRMNTIEEGVADDEMYET